jgi:hypothetical protein
VSPRSEAEVPDKTAVNKTCRCESPHVDRQTPASGRKPPTVRPVVPKTVHFVTLNKTMRADEARV